MAKSERIGRVYFDYLRNAEGASAVAPYSTRKLPGPPCAVPLAWDELTDELDIRAFTPGRVLERAKAGVNPWGDLAGPCGRLTTAPLCRGVGVGAGFARGLGEFAHLAGGGLGEVLADHQPQRAHQVLGHLAQVGLFERVRGLRSACSPRRLTRMRAPTR